MRILYILNKPMFPLVDGGCMASYTLLKNMLHLGFGVKYLTLETEKHPFNLDEFPKDLQNIINPEAFFVDTSVKAKDAILSLFSNKSYNMSRFHSQGFEQMIAEELRQGDYGVVVLENTYSLPYASIIRKHSKAKVILRTHNLEYRIWEQLAREEKNFLKRIFLKKLAKNLKQYEIEHLPLTDGIAAISEDDLRKFKQLGLNVPVRCIPVSMDFKVEAPVQPSSDFFFLGSMNWQPNVESVDYLLKDIFPKIVEQLPDAKLHLAGSYMPERLMKLQHPNIVVHGKVDSVKDFMTTHGTLLVPMKSGSGIRIKILEALSMGIPVISTTIGFEGIPVEQEIHGLRADTTEELVASAVKLSKDGQLAARLGKNGQQMVLTTYSQENVSKKLLDFIESI